MRGLFRWSCRLLVLLVLAAAGLSGYLEGCQWLQRFRAERLLRDVTALQVNQSSWADVQRLMTRWGRWGDYDGSCDQAHCLYRISLRDAFPDWMYAKEDGYRSLRGRRLRDHIGLHRASVYSGFVVRDGRVADKFFSVDLDRPFTSLGPDLTVDSEEGPRLLPDESDDRVLHPYHSLSGEKLFIVLSTPKEDAAEREKLMRFHFDCLTALRGCVDRARILPEAYGEFQAQQAAVAIIQRMYCPIPYWMTARDEQTVLLVDVLSATLKTQYGDGIAGEPITTGDPYWVMQMRVREKLKGNLSSSVGEPFFLRLSRKRIASDANGAFPYKTLLVAGRATGSDSVAFMGPIQVDDDCGITGTTPASLAEAQRGVREDYGAGVPPQ